MARGAVGGFLPSASAFHFPNRFPPGPVFRPGMGLFRVPIGDASRGLCGGMVFAARDLHEAGLPPPADTEPPPQGTPLFRYLARRLLGSWRLPWGMLRYAWWSVLPDRDRGGLRGVVRRTVEDQWPAVRRDVDGGLLCPLGLVRVRTMNPWRMAHNHQVLVYAYDVPDDGPATLRVYDPNRPDDDDATIGFDPHDPFGSFPIPYGNRAIRGFFRTAYSPPRSGITLDTNSSR